MSEYQLYNWPLGAKDQEPSLADFAEVETSRKLVSTEQFDSSFFRGLERAGIFLNAPQIEAVRHFTGPFLTVAGAGSGKTSVLVCRTAYLIAVHKVPARSILLVTFTKKAADEMKERIGTLPGLSRAFANQVQARTFHSFFLTLLKGMGYTQEILSNERYKQLVIKRFVKEFGLMEDQFQPETLLSTLSFYKMNLKPIESMKANSQDEKHIKSVLLAYEDWKQKTNQWDFDDILVEAHKLLSTSQSLLHTLQERFQYIMVDEFQDTNFLQYELIRLISGNHHNLFVVGDDDQTIYSFNGAKHEFLLNFDGAFPETKSVVLDINYRSTPAILGLGNKIIQHNKKRRPKQLKAAVQINGQVPKFLRPNSTDQEAEWVVERIKKSVLNGEQRYRDIAILHRTQSNARAIFEQLTIEGLPFVDYSSGQSFFYDQWPVKTLIGYLKLSLNPRDFDSMEELLPTLYINRENGMEHILNQEKILKKKYPLIHLTSLGNLKEFQKDQIKKRITMLKELQQKSPLEAIEVMRKGFYDHFLKADERDQSTLAKETLKESLDELEASAKRFRTVSAFLEFIDTLRIKQEEMQRLKIQTDSDAINLMTIHRSKGLEFPVVFLIGASEGILPHSTSLENSELPDRMGPSGGKSNENAELEEERRLCYVAITRAKTLLYISSPSFYRGKKAAVSRFLLEAFGTTADREDERAGSHKNVIRKNDPRSSARSSYTVTVLAWICTSKTCKGWQRILTLEDSELAHKECPICKSSMEKGAKEVQA